VKGVLNRYREDIRRLEEYLSGNEAFSLRGSTSIPAIMFAKDGGQPAAVLFLLETEALEERATGGGFVTRDRRMVSIIKSQILSAAESA